MSVTAPAAPAKTNGLTTVLDVITSPAKAFETLRAVPMWGWAYIITCILAMIGQYLATAGVMHAITAGWPAQVAANPQLAAMTPEQQQRGLQFAMAAVKWAWLFTPVILLFCALLQSVLMLIFKAIGRGDASFKQLWASAMNTLLVGFGLYNIVYGLIVVVRGPASFNSSQALITSVPGLSWLVPGAPLKLAAFLGAFNIFAIWGAVLLTMAMTTVARTNRAVGIGCAVVTTVLAGLYFSMSIK